MRLPIARFPVARFPIVRLSAVLSVICAATAALAHGPTPQKIDQSIVIPATPEAVWTVAGDFGGIARWHPDVAKAEATGGNAEGATRKVTLKAGGTLVEGLDEWKADAHTYTYRMSDPDLTALPVSSYSATLTVTPEGQGSKVSWSGRFYRGDTGNEPPENLGDEAGRTAMNRYVSDGLKGLKAAVEGKATH